MKKITKINFYIFLSILFIFVFNISFVSAQILNRTMVNSIAKQESGFKTNTGYDTSMTLSDVAYIIIRTFLSILGIIFISLMVYGGYLWMTARGDESAVEKAKKLITQAVIGLVIIVASYSITYFVFNYLLDASP